MSALFEQVLGGKTWVAKAVPSRPAKERALRTLGEVPGELLLPVVLFHLWHKSTALHQNGGTVGSCPVASLQLELNLICFASKPPGTFLASTNSLKTISCVGKETSVKPKNSSDVCTGHKIL